MNYAAPSSYKELLMLLSHELNCGRFCFLALFVSFSFLFVIGISREPQNEFVSNSHGRRVSCFGRTGVL